MSHRRMIRLLAASLVLLGLPLARAMAQPIDLSGGGPIAVTARGGFEWQENQQRVIATGDARAVRDNVTVTADRLVALYRKKATPTGAPGGTPGSAPVATPAAATSATPTPGEADTGGNEVYRLEAEGHVLITTPTDQARGDHAVYDIDQAVLVMTGHDLKLTTPQEVLTARDSLEYWSARHMAVGRGNAVVLTTDGRRLAADTLVGYTQPDTNAPAVKPAPGTPESAGKLQRVEAFGNVEVRTTADIVRGDRGVYVADSGLARVIGDVRITHGQNQLNGPAADVNMKTGVAYMLSDPNQRVQGLIMPNDATDASVLSPGNPSGKPSAKPAPGKPTTRPGARP